MSYSFKIDAVTITLALFIYLCGCVTGLLIQDSIRHSFDRWTEAYYADWTEDEERDQ